MEGSLSKGAFFGYPVGDTMNTTFRAIGFILIGVAFLELALVVDERDAKQHAIKVEAQKQDDAHRKQLEDLQLEALKCYIREHQQAR